MKVTADSITDEQIREWESDVCEHGTNTEKREAVDLATVALGPVARAADFAAFSVVLEGPGREEMARDANRKRRAARARCADIWNARHAIEKRRCNECGALCDHSTWDGVNCPWCRNDRHGGDS